MSLKIVGVLDKLLNGFVLIVGIFLMLIGTYSMLDNLWVYQNAGDKSLKVYRPDVDIPLSDDKKITENQVAWITMDDTTIDYPVMQGDDNAVYLNKDPYGKFSLSGSIFLDFRNSSDFSDDYSLIYGHHMQGDAMFGALDVYVDESYFDEHLHGVLTTDDGVYDYDLFAVIEDDGANQLLFDPVRYSKVEILDYLKNNSLIYRDFDENLRLLALSTCQGGMTDRLLIFGTLTVKNEVVEDVAS